MQADEYARFGYPPVHGVAVDAYAASHGGDGSERRDRQSVLLHLVALCAIFERDATSEQRIALLQRLARVKRDYPILARPDGYPALTFLHASGAADATEYDARVREWARSVWEFWAPAHEVVRGYLD
jgi:hypothetical protein